ncbi:hypothetical protein DFH06DRAFT_1343650 [Mycena polygramma]|nr:hypothetical protein DFH06DRAFT_1343650 [Mycena polygramma]
MATPCPAASSILDRLPRELRRIVYDIVLDHQQLLPFRSRARVCSTCRSWRDFVEATPAYWTVIPVDSVTPASFVLRWAALADTLPLEFTIVLNSSEPVLPLGYLLAFLLRAGRLTIESDRCDTLTRLRQTFHGLSTPALTYFAATLHRVPSSYAQFVLPPVDEPWFPDAGADSTLEILDLNCCPLPFPRLIYPRLRELYLSGRHYRYNIDAAHLAVVMSAGPPDVHSSSVQELDLTFSHTDDTVLLASTFDFPALSKLTIDVTSLRDAVYLAQMPPATLSTVSALVFRKRLLRRDPFTILSPDLLTRFYNVTSLDIRLCHSWIFPQLLTSVSQHAAATGATLLPRLSSLSVHRVSLDDLTAFAVLYGASDDDDGTRSVLRHIRTTACLCARSLAADAVGKRQWLTAHVLDFVVVFFAHGTDPNYDV